MDFMDWALKTAGNHPQLHHSLVTANGDWLEILLADGRTFRFRPSALIQEDAPLAARTEALNRLISVGIKNAPEISTAHTSASEIAPQDSTAPKSAFPLQDPPPGDPENNRGTLKQTVLPDPDSAANPLPTPLADAVLLPIVRNAEIFLNSHHRDDSIVYLPLTDFIAAGIALDFPDEIRPIYYSQITADNREVGELLANSVLELRGITDSLNDSLKLEVMKIAGAEIISFTNPANYESSWFCDLEMLQQLAQQISAAHDGALPLFVPAATTKFYLIFDTDPHLADFFVSF
ncbi:hypothetical protein [Arcanobacterium hippocoleae]|uniref:hypothetical protein n=1 Tax=Arcanobacterium hippocoleae TaxID=149017 RepID=UPI0033400466